jgi:hypothetical protein
MSRLVPRYGTKEDQAKDEAKLRRLCDGTRTVKEVATLMGWAYDRTREHIRKHGLQTAKDLRI